MPKKRFSVLSFSVYSFHYNFYFSYETLILLQDLKVYNIRDIIIFLFKLNQFCYTVFWAFILPNLSGIFIKQSLTSLHSFKFVWSAFCFDLIGLIWFWDRVLSSVDWPQNHYVPKHDLELFILQFQTFRSWDKRHESPTSAQSPLNWAAQYFFTLDIWSLIWSKSLCFHRCDDMKSF